MSRIKIKIFTSAGCYDDNFMGRRFDRLLNSWLEEKSNIEILDYNIKVSNDSDETENTGAILIIKYRELNKRELRIEKVE